MDNNFKLSRPGIKGKIFGIAISLLVLMTTVAIHSYMQIEEVGDELHIISEKDIPIMETITAINISAYMVELEFQECMRILESGVTEQERIDYHNNIDDIDRINSKIAADIVEARKLIEEAIRLIPKESRKLSFVRLDTLINKIESEHHGYVLMTRQVIEDLINGKVRESKAVENILRQERNQAAREITEAMLLMRQIFKESTHEALENESEVIYMNIIVTAIAAVIGLLASYLLTKGLLRPLFNLVTGAEEVASGKLDVDLNIRINDEVGKLTHSFNNMTQELRIKERIKETFGHYMDPRIVEGLISKPETLSSTGEKQEMTMFFSDIKGFTTISEGLTPRALVELLNEYLSRMSDSISKQNGVIDKYIGDAIMAFWGQPFTENAIQRSAACDAALGNLKLLEEFRKDIPEIIGVRAGLDQVFDLRIGIATGDVIVGNIGSDITKSYTVIGDTVNLAARLESINKQYGTRLILSENTKTGLDETYITRELDLIKVMGKKEPVKIFELIGKGNEVSSESLELKNTFERGLQLYRKADWAAANTVFSNCLKIKKDDGPTNTFINRIGQLKQTSPANWDGIWAATSK